MCRDDSVIKRYTEKLLLLGAIPSYASPDGDAFTLFVGPLERHTGDHSIPCTGNASTG